MKKVLGALATVGLIAVVNVGGALAQAQCSVWLVESSRFMKVPFGAFMPDRVFVPGSTSANNNIPTVDLPVNIGVIKCGEELILYDTGWKQQDYLKMTGSDHWVGDCRPAQGSGLQRRPGDQDRGRPWPLGPCRTACGFAERGALYPARGAERHRVGAQLSRTRRSARSTPIRAAACARRPAVTRRSPWMRSTARCWPARR